ncbi:MAG: alpha/beta hydrolase [Myxococcota bacterium]
MTRQHLPESGWQAVRANGLDIAFFEAGEGPLLILQHGFPDTPHTWDDVTPALVDAGFRVVRPFGRGIHPSEKPPDDAFSAKDLAGDLVALIDALDAETATIVGHDWGALAAWGAGYMAPERIDKLITVAIPHPGTLRLPLSRAWSFRHFIANRLPWAERRFRANDFGEIRKMYERWSPGFSWPESEFEAAKNAYAWPGCLDAAMGYYRRLGGWPFAGDLTVETLVIGGETDGVATVEDFKRSRRRISAPCTIEILPGGHFLHREHPEPFLSTVLKFLCPQ